eukprot:gene26968-32583_t
MTYDNILTLNAGQIQLARRYRVVFVDADENSTKDFSTESSTDRQEIQGGGFIFALQRAIGRMGHYTHTVSWDALVSTNPHESSSVPKDDELVDLYVLLWSNKLEIAEVPLFKPHAGATVVMLVDWTDDRVTTVENGGEGSTWKETMVSILQHCHTLVFPTLWAKTMWLSFWSDEMLPLSSLVVIPKGLEPAYYFPSPWSFPAKDSLSPIRLCSIMPPTWGMDRFEDGIQYFRSLLGSLDCSRRVVLHLAMHAQDENNPPSLLNDVLAQHPPVKGMYIHNDTQTGRFLRGCDIFVALEWGEVVGYPWLSDYIIAAITSRIPVIAPDEELFEELIQDGGGVYERGGLEAPLLKDLEGTVCRLLNRLVRGVIAGMFPKKEQKVIKSKGRKQVSLYREASSDDEFARQHLIFPSSDSEGGKGRGRKGKKKTKKTKPSSLEEGLIENSSDSGDDDDMNYRIQHILGRRSLSAKDWRKITDSMTTREITKGSAWQQPDDEYYDTSDSPVEKFLIKWAHASYLHVSWETEKDLVDNVGKAVKLQIKKFLQRESEGTELFDDLAKGEYFPASFVTIDRILDVDDKAVNIHKVDWKIASLPDISKKDGDVEEKKDDGEDVKESKASEATDLEEQGVKGEEEVVSGDGDDASHLDDFDDLYFGDEDDEKSAVESDDDVVEVVEEESKVTTELGRGRRARGKKNYSEDDSEEQWWKKMSKKSKGDEKDDNKTARKKSSAKKIIRFDPLLLHRDECYLTIKWEGLPYSEVSFESVQDIFRANIEYESPLRAFYAREQKDGVDMAKDVETGKRKLRLGEDVIGPTSVPPPFKGGVLRDYQWEGVRWMLYNMGQQRNCILADEMGLGKTIQSAALIQMLKRVSQPTAGPFLIIAPLSLIVNWQREIATWTDCDSILYYGSQDDRELIRTFEFSFLDYGKRGGSVKSGAGGKSKKAGCKIEVVITTPETCVALDTTTATGRGKRELSNIHWDLVIVDEAHKLKNYDSKLGITLRE